jgi:hypothetical protein
MHCMPTFDSARCNALHLAEFAEFKLSKFAEFILTMSAESRMLSSMLVINASVNTLHPDQG